MTLVKKHIEQYFWILLCLSIVAGFAFPSVFLPFENVVIFLVMAIICLLFMKVDIIDVVTHVKSPGLLLYVSLFNLFVVPMFTYFLFNSLDEHLLAGLVLLASLPSGVSSAAFTDIMKGKTSLTLTIIIVTNLLSIISIPLIFAFFFKHSIELDTLSMFINLIKVFLIPLIVAKVLKRLLFRGLHDKLSSYYNILIISLLSFMIMISISFQAEFILQNLDQHLQILGILFIAFFFFQLLGYFSVYWMKKGDKVAVSNASMIMNNILGIVISIAFFPPEIVTIVILSFIPWNTMIIAKHWYKKFLP